MRVRCAVLGVATTLLACNGASKGNCNAGACGGDLVGSWTITGACSNASSATAATAMTGCPSETVKVTSSSTSGTLTFNADMTFTASESVSAVETATVPLSCLSAGGIETCDELAMTFEGLLGDASTSSATCTTSGSNCDCNVVLSIQTSTDTGTYSVSGDSFTTMSQNGVGSGTYCVAGNTLTVIASSDGGTMTSAGDLVATKE